jgi:hypothetical protein
MNCRRVCMIPPAWLRYLESARSTRSHRNHHLTRGTADRSVDVVLVGLAAGVDELQKGVAEHPSDVMAIGGKQHSQGGQWRAGQVCGACPEMASAGSPPAAGLSAVDMLITSTPMRRTPGRHEKGNAVEGHLPEAMVLAGFLGHPATQQTRPRIRSQLPDFPAPRSPCTCSASPTAPTGHLGFKQLMPEATHGWWGLRRAIRVRRLRRKRSPAGLNLFRTCSSA